MDLKVSVGGAAPVPVELGTAGGSGEMDVNGFRLTLEGLGPDPVTDRPIRPDDYSATISVRKL